jgi:AmmeMemoRadiSam system protein A
MIASSDLYHGYDSDECRHSDERTLEAILRMDPSRFLRALDRGEIQACGAGPIAALLTAAREMGADHAELLASTNSGEVTGNPRGYVVGYAAVALMRGAPEDRVRVSGESTEQALTEEERRTLLALAREALDRAVRCLEPPDPPAPLPAALGARRRCFVTLHRGSQLRGCIGYAEARRPLARAVIDLARAAALEDMRFAPVSIDELGEISIEVSVLTEPVPVSDVAEIEPGRHGVLVSRGLRRALLLPQVAEEQGWDARRLLEHCCLKAGLPAESWSDAETEIQRFEAEVFGAGAPSRSGYEGGTGGAGASR